ncbi:MAG TPA: endonuclease/exonuclease/phosphatase family protein [Euzebyales bacterium]|nr:endonuclease/exonuclease/phosphatase family protein [Euzebyales bacterium]
MRRHTATALVALLVLAVSAAPAGAAGGRTPTIRVATYNASLNRATQGELLSDLRAGDDQARAVADIIGTVRPDVLLLNEFDHDPEAAAVFADDYLGGRYPYRYTDTCNTGVASGSDLNGDGVVGTSVGTPEYANDALGFGFFPGQFCMLVLSRFPIDARRVRTYQQFRWADMPGALLPDDPTTPAPADFYTPEELRLLPLSSKSHWDLPIRVGPRQTVHLLVSHPTPPTFDGPEDRNGTRNHDEIRFWADYISPHRGRYITDDNGRRGGLPHGAAFVVAGDQNADPFDGDSTAGAAQQLLEHPLINAGRTPASAGGVEDAALDGGINLSHEGDPAHDTADFSEPPGNLRVDYVLPRRSLRIVRSGVFWPTTTQPGHELIAASDHRMVWIDVRLSGRRR